MPWVTSKDSPWSRWVSEHQCQCTDLQRQVDSLKREIDKLNRRLKKASIP
jgi:hypothetical protein